MSICLQKDEVTAWMAGLRQRAARDRIPLTAHLELTSRCNLRCQHCYLGDQLEQSRKRGLERDTAAVCKSIDEWAAAGCLHLVITGGDPMMRRDFKDVYRHAAEVGIFVTVFCDGILVSDAIVDLFRAYPPRSVEISIYGATPETYEKVTQVPGSHAAAWIGIHRLRDIGVKVALKTVLLTLNEHELGDMRAQAEAAGCPFHYDAAIFPCLPDGSSAPLDLRVAPEAVVAAELQDQELVDEYRKAIQHFEGAPASASIYQCGAGLTAFYADPYGVLSPCLLTTQYQYKAEGRSFDEMWETDLAAIRNRKRTRADSALVSGGLRGACTHCPAVNFLETGDEEQDSPYMVEMTRLRYAAVMKKEAIE